MAEVEIFRLFFLVMLRFIGLIVAAPVIGSGNFPMRGKVALAFFAAMLVTPVMPVLETAIPEATWGYVAWGAGEFLIGIMMGFVMTLVFATIQLGGQLMDMQTGFGMMNVFNPAMETQFPIYGFFLFILAVLYLLLVNGHHLMLRAVLLSFEHVPLGGFVARPALFYEVTRWGSAMFSDGLMIASPVVCAMLLAYITMGLLGRVVPQIHLFVVGFPITITTGLLLTALILSVYIDLLDKMFLDMFKHVETVMRSIG